MTPPEFEVPPDAAVTTPTGSISLCLAFDDLVQARVFGAWIAGLPVIDDEQFCLETTNLSREWDFFYEEPWQPDTITLPSNSFALKVSGNFLCDPRGPQLAEAVRFGESTEADVKAFDEFVDAFVLSLVGPLREQPEPWDVDVVYVQGREEDWRKVFIPKKEGP
mgnify:CR=1 FL=1